jgi:Abortive infection alpha
MSEEKKTENVKDTIDAVTGLVKAVPVYEDGLQPAVKEIGKALATVAKTVNVALAPLSVLVWGYDNFQDFINKRVSAKLQNVASEKIVTPDLTVVGPAFEALRYSGKNETLSEMFANLIANSMDSDTAKYAHPSFVEIIKNMTADEGLIIKAFTPNIYKPIIDVKLKIVQSGGEFNLLENYSIIGQEAGCTHLELVPSYLNNLCRLGLLQMPPGRQLIEANAYDSLVHTKEYQDFEKQYIGENTTVTRINKYIELTTLGVQFKNACLNDKK